MAALDGNPQIAEGDGFKILLELVKQASAQGATLEAIRRDLSEMRSSTSQQLTSLTERMGRSEALNGIQDEKIRALEDRADAARAERADALKQVQELQQKLWRWGGLAAGVILMVEVVSWLGSVLGWF